MVVRVMGKHRDIDDLRGWEGAGCVASRRCPGGGRPHSATRQVVAGKAARELGGQRGGGGCGEEQEGLCGRGHGGTEMVARSVIEWGCVLIAARMVDEGGVERALRGLYCSTQHGLPRPLTCLKIP